MTSTFEDNPGAGDAGHEAVGLPMEVVADLRAIADPAVDVPASFDDAVLNLARTHFAGVQSNRGRRHIAFAHRRAWITAATIALAATIVGAIMLSTWKPPMPVASLPPRGPYPPAPMLGDIDGNRRVDIVDAYSLARILDDAKSSTGPTIPMGGGDRLRVIADLNADGGVNAADVEAIVQRAVSLDVSVSSVRNAGKAASVRAVGTLLRVPRLCEPWLEVRTCNDARTADTAVAHGSDLAALVAAAVFAMSQDAAGAGPPMHFEAIDVFIDAGEHALAAWQVEFADAKGIATIVGIETGEHAAFPNAPKYDPRAMQHERAIVADFSLAGAESLPTGRVRVTTIHVMWEGDHKPDYEVTLAAAAGVDGKAIESATAEIARATDN